MIRDQLARSRAGGLLVTSLDDVAWLFNLRGSDVAYNPVFLSYGIVTPETATLYVDVDKVRGVQGASAARRVSSCGPVFRRRAFSAAQCDT